MREIERESRRDQNCNKNSKMGLSTIDILLVLKTAINSTEAVQDFYKLMMKHNIENI